MLPFREAIPPSWPSPVRMMPADKPYLSLVVTARYDDHGGSFMLRMQAFLNAFLEQCRRHRLPAEVIVVEWNPLPDRCRLAQALEWPIEMDWCKVRFIEVPPEIHARYQHGAQLPLYQMIAKNVALRHVRSEWVLATNIDILFNDPLMRFLAQRRLERNKMYRIDRHDADEGVPLWATVDEQLQYCETHLLRVMAREGTFRLNSKGLREWDGPDITLPEDGIAFGSGWFSPEMDEGKPFRHVDHNAVMELPVLPAANTLLVTVQAGVGADGPINVRFVQDGATLAEARIEAQRETVRVPIAASNVASRMVVQVEAKRWVVPYDPRDLILKVLEVVLETALNGGPVREPRREPVEHLPEPVPPATEAEPAPPLEPPRLTFADRAAIWMRENMPPLHAVLAPAYRQLTGRAVEPVPEALEPPPECIPSTAQEAGSESVPEAADVALPPVRIGSPAGVRPPVYLHTNACGDFTLMHIDHWIDMRGYAEFDAYSMNIDSVLCWAAHFGCAREEMLREPMRAYHIEHGRGSGWTPEGRELLYRRIKAAGLPWIEYPDLMSWVHSMNELNCPIIFNKANWGLRDDVLRETAPDLGSARLRWCAQDSASPSRMKARANELLQSESSPATTKAERQTIAETCAKLGWKLGPGCRESGEPEIELDLRTPEGRDAFVNGPLVRTDHG